MTSELRKRIVSQAISDLLQSPDAESTIHLLESGEQNAKVVLFGKKFSPQEARELIVKISGIINDVVFKINMINNAEFECALQDAVCATRNEEEDYRLSRRINPPAC